MSGVWCLVSGVWLGSLEELAEIFVKIVLTPSVSVRVRLRLRVRLRVRVRVKIRVRVRVSD